MDGFSLFSLDLNTKECDDCGKMGVEWTSINRGVLICSECCTIHRNLGRAISYVRHLSKSAWDEQHLKLVYALSSADANRIWEGALNETSSKIRKPRWTDPIYPHKDAFIREKYVNGAFLLTKRKRNDGSDTESLNRELFSCARSDYVHVALRLLALGANVNYVDEESGETSLHVAAREGRELQVELLMIYGSKQCKNKNGESAFDVATKEGHTALASRIFAMQFYVSDRFTMFLCGRKPEHDRMQHFLVPELTDKSLMEKTNLYRRSIQRLHNEKFFEFVLDVHDELDRREVESAWQAANCPRASKFVTLFLPLDENMSATRNQGRQKLAKCDALQFATLIIDMLKECKRRFLCEPLVDDSANTKEMKGVNDTILSRISTNLKNDEYDDVPGASVRSPSVGQKTQSSLFNEDRTFSYLDELLELKEKFAASQDNVASLTAHNAELTKIVHSLQQSMTTMSSEFMSMREEMSRVGRMQINRRLPSPLTTSTLTEYMIMYNYNSGDIFDGRQPPVHSSNVHRPGPVGGNSARRESEDRPDSGRWRSNSTDRRSSNDRRVEANDRRQELNERRMDMNERRSELNDRRLEPTERRVEIVERRPEQNDRRMELNDRRADSADRRQEMRINNALPNHRNEVHVPISQQSARQHDDYGALTSVIRQGDRVAHEIRLLLNHGLENTLDMNAGRCAFEVSSSINALVQILPEHVDRERILALADSVALLNAKCNAPRLSPEMICEAAHTVADRLRQILLVIM